MGFDFLAPLDEETVLFIESLSSQHLGSKVVLHTDKDFPDLDQVKIAIVGAMENRGQNKTEPVDLSYIREELYQLFPGNWHVSIADLGNILPGNSAEDSYFALQQVIAELCELWSLPAAWGVPSGHDPRQNNPLTFGAPAHLTVTAQAATVTFNTPL